MYKNRNDFFYQTVKNGLSGLTKYNPKLAFTDDVDLQKSPSITIAMDYETKVIESAKGDYSLNILSYRICNFQVVFYEALNIKDKQAANLRDASFKWIDLIESNIKLLFNKLIKNNEANYDYTDPISNIPIYNIQIKDIDITRIWKTLPENDNNTYMILFECEIKYQQRLFNLNNIN